MTKLELEQCIEEYGTDIYSFCLHLTGNRQQADELYQETFLKAVEKRSEILSDGNVKSYLLSVAVRLWRNWRRKAAWRSRIAAVISSAAPEEEKGIRGIHPDSRQEKRNGQPSETEGQALTPEQIVLEQELCRAVRDAVDRLPEKLRTVTLLCYMEECSTAEICGILNIPQGTVKSRLFQARKRLEKELESVLNE